MKNETQNTFEPVNFESVLIDWVIQTQKKTEEKQNLLREKQNEMILDIHSFLESEDEDKDILEFFLKPGHIEKMYGKRNRTMFLICLKSVCDELNWGKQAEKKIIKAMN